MKRVSFVGIFVVALLILACSDNDPPTGPTTGSITVTVTTTGEGAPASYTVVLDGGTTHSIGANGSSTFTNVPMGSHEVELTDLPANCAVTGANPVTVTVSAGGTTPVAMNVTCATLVGAIEVVAQTTGTDLDIDGYLVSVDGLPAEPLSSQGSHTFSDLIAGPHEIALSDIAPNCLVAGAVTRDVNVQAEQTSTETFDLECESASKLLFRSPGSELLTINPDGSDPQILIMDPDRANLPIWSADGRIAFWGTYGGATGTFVMGSDGSQVTLVADTSGMYMAWSPDGTRIAASNFADIFVMNVDGSGVVPVTDDPDIADHDPFWSTDGTQIVFSRFSVGGGPESIYVINSDGSDLTRLTTNPQGMSDMDPAWSPDGSRIAFIRGYEEGGESYNGIYSMNPDGTDLLNVSGGPGGDSGLSWSPDGTQIAFRSFRDGIRGIYVVNADGSGLTLLAEESQLPSPPSWSPDGTRIAYHAYDGLGKIYTVRIDGTDKFLVSDVGGDPLWSPVLD